MNLNKFCNINFFEHLNEFNTFDMVWKPPPSGILQWKIFWKKEEFVEKAEDENFSLFM